MGTTSIEWTEKTWNPVVGCSVLSPGCKRCYAMKMAVRLERMGVEHYKGLTEAGAWNGTVRQAPEHIVRAPLAWKKPVMVFVNSMSDLFHEDMPQHAIRDAFEVMEWTPQHIYQVLTKRGDRMRDWVAEHYPTPLPNVWLGVSVEDRPRKGRIAQLQATPAAVRFVSAEPLLSHLGEVDLTGIHWLIAGGESGSGARWCNWDAYRSLRDQCAQQGVAFFFKQAAREAGGPILSLPELDGVQHKAFPQKATP